MANIVPYTTDDLISFLAKLDEEAKSWKGVWDKRWDRNVSSLRNEMKFTTDIEPMFYAPLIGPSIKRKAGMLVENKPVFDVKVRKKGLMATAETLKRLSAASWDEQKVPMSMETLAYHLGAFGNGFFKISYDKDADYGDGDMTICCIDPRMIFLDPAVSRAIDVGNPDTCMYIREDSVVSLSWIRKKFPKEGAKVEPDNLLTFSSDETRHSISYFKRMMDKFRGENKAAESAIPRCMLKEYWINDGETDGGRHIFMVNNNLVLNPAKKDQLNPYFDKLWPYEMLDNEPDMDHPWGHAEVDAIRKLDEAVNRIGHHFIRAIVRNVPWNIVDTNSVSPETLQDLKELEEVIIEKTAGRQVVRNPATMPSNVNLQFMQMAQGLVDFILGFSDPQSGAGGKGRAEVRSMPQFEGLQQASQTLIRSQCRRLEAFIERVGTKMISRYFQFYTDDRIMVYVDNDEIKQFEFEKGQLRNQIIELAESVIKEQEVTQTQEKIDAGTAPEKAITLLDPEERMEVMEKHIQGAWRMFRFKIVPFSSLSSSKTQRAMLLQQLAQIGAIPMEMILKELGFENPTELAEKAIQEKAMLAALMKKYGVEPPPPPKKGGKK